MNASSTSRRMSVVGWSDPRGRGRRSPSNLAGSVTSTRSSARIFARRSSSTRFAASSAAVSIRPRTALSSIPVSRSRTSRSASFSGLRRPRYRTFAASSWSGIAAASKAFSASRAYAAQSTRRLYLYAVSAYDRIARLYDAWSTGVVEDISFYVEEALASGGPVVELGVGTGRIAIPTAMAGVHVIGVDSSAEMLAVCGEAARAAGVSERLHLRLGDLRKPPVPERVPLVTCPFRAFLHLASDAERLAALDAARALLLPGGRLVFDVFAPSDEDIEETHGRWLEREPGIFERADWDRGQQTLTLSVRGERGESSMILWWLEPQRWQALLAEAGYAVDACY